MSTQLSGQQQQAFGEGSVHVSNARPIAIFAGYMATAVVLTAASIAAAIPSRGIDQDASRSRHNGDVSGGSATRRRRPALLAFAALAVVSLATTWFHMFCFFRWSYADWAAARALPAAASPHLRLGKWLRDTMLFEQAWASTLQSPPRAWWSLQILGFCVNWSITLAVQAHKRALPRMWILMLLGQVVAISFAMNLSFLVFLLHDVSSRERRRQQRPPTSSIPWYHLILWLDISLVLAVPGSFGLPHFMCLLLALHLLSFAPLLLRGQQRPADPSWGLMAASQAVILAVATSMVARQKNILTELAEALYEHPAVSSVGWDVICCWLSSAAWYMLGDEAQ